MKIIWSIVVVLAAFVVVSFIFVQWVKRNSLFYPDVYPRGFWDFEKTYSPAASFFTTPDGVRLHGWYFGSHPGGPLLIWFHGNGGNITHRAPVASELAKRGTNVFLFDYRGYGRSGGRPTEAKLFIDSLAAYDFAVKEYGADKSVVLYGESLGGPYAAHVANRRNACAVILENTFPSLAELGNELYRPIPIGYLVYGSLRTADWLRKASLPVLVVHGERDEVISFRLGKTLYDQLSQPKEFLSSAVAEHSGFAEAEGERFYSTVSRFLTTHCNR